MAEPILQADNLCLHFGDFQAVKDVSFAVTRGQTLSIVGESGCGKTTTARILMGLNQADSGQIYMDGLVQNPHLKKRARDSRRRMQYIFQDPIMSLNPRKTVRQILAQPLSNLTDLDAAQVNARIEELMQLVSLRPEFIDRYPHEFSGGQCQRIGIARALATSPDILVLDEPVSALDVSVQAQILNLLKLLQRELQLSYVFISHDLAVVETLSDYVMVMYAGEIVEQGTRIQIFNEPRQAYTQRLLASVPRLS